MAYNFTAQWVKGNKNDAPDTLSRNPVSDPEPADNLAELDSDDLSKMSFAELRALHDASAESIHLQDLWQHVQQDFEYQ